MFVNIEFPTVKSTILRPTRGVTELELINSPTIVLQKSAKSGSERKVQGLPVSNFPLIFALRNSQYYLVQLHLS